MEFKRRILDDCRTVEFDTKRCSSFLDITANELFTGTEMHVHHKGLKNIECT